MDSDRTIHKSFTITKMDYVLDFGDRVVTITLEGPGLDKIKCQAAVTAKPLNIQPLCKGDPWSPLNKSVFSLEP